MPSKSRDTTRGAVYWKATLFPVAWPITSTMVCGSRPAFAPRTSASMTAIRPTWASMLLTSFITSPCPMDDLRSHGLEDGLGFLDCQGIAADKRLQRSKLRTLLHAANRRVDQVDSSRSELLMHLLHRRGVDSAHADHDIAGLRLVDKAASADDDLFRLRGGVDHRDDPARERRHRRGRTR